MPGRSSPLYRRIARHAGLATIFRQPQAGQAAAAGITPAPGNFPVVQTGEERPVQPVKARLLPADSRLPEARLLPHLPTQAASEPNEGQPPAPAPTFLPKPAPIQTAPAPVPPNRPEPMPDQPVLQSNVQQDIPPAAQVAGPADEDRNWRRLQTIFNRHQEKQQAAQAFEETPVAEQTAVDEQNIPVEKYADQEPEVMPPAKSGEILQAPAQKPKPAAPPRSGTDQPAQQPEPLSAPPASPVQRQPAAPFSPPAGPQPPSKGPSTPGTHEDTQRPPSVSQAEPDDEVTESRPTQSLPLEAVWPVQRNPQKPEAIAGAPTQNRPPEVPKIEPVEAEPSETPTVVAHLPDAVRPEAPPPGPDTPHETGLAHLQQVRSGQPSASRIDVIPPRRPHPLLKPESSPEKPVAPEPASLSPEQPAEPIQDSAVNIQTQKESSKTQSSPAPEQTPPRQVPTEIGLLPEDLWRLLGEEPPPAEGDTAPLTPAKPSREAATPTSPQPPEASIASAPAPKPVAADKTKSEQGAIQRAIAAAESHQGPDRPAHDAQSTPSPDARETPIKNVLPPIQHLQTAINIPDIGKPTLEKPNQPEESELDLDDLARKVYGQVRRKLEIEFERQHKRS